MKAMCAVDIFMSINSGYPDCVIWEEQSDDEQLDEDELTSFGLDELLSVDEPSEEANEDET
jgi:hypothetical protein